jgi:hypothetical protein
VCAGSDCVADLVACCIVAAGSNCFADLVGEQMIVWCGTSNSLLYLVAYKICGMADKIALQIELLPKSIVAWRLTLLRISSCLTMTIVGQLVMMYSLEKSLSFNHLSCVRSHYC